MKRKKGFTFDIRFWHSQKVGSTIAQVHPNCLNAPGGSFYMQGFACEAVSVTHGSRSCPAEHSWKETPRCPLQLDVAAYECIYKSAVIYSRCRFIVLQVDRCIIHLYIYISPTCVSSFVLSTWSLPPRSEKKQRDADYEEPERSGSVLASWASPVQDVGIFGITWGFINPKVVDFGYNTATKEIEHALGIAWWIDLQLKPGFLVEFCF